MSEPTSDPLNFEQALADLERIVRALEDGQIGLEEALAHYEQGVALLRREVLLGGKGRGTPPVAIPQRQQPARCQLFAACGFLAGKRKPLLLQLGLLAHLRKLITQLAEIQPALGDRSQRLAVELGQHRYDPLVHAVVHEQHFDAELPEDLQMGAVAGRGESVGRRIPCD